MLTIMQATYIRTLKIFKFKNAAVLHNRRYYINYVDTHYKQMLQKLKA